MFSVCAESRKEAWLKVLLTSGRKNQTLFALSYLIMCKQDPPTGANKPRMLLKIHWVGYYTRLQ